MLLLNKLVITIHIQHYQNLPKKTIDSTMRNRLKQVIGINCIVTTSLYEYVTFGLHSIQSASVRLYMSGTCGSHKQPAVTLICTFLLKNKICRMNASFPASSGYLELVGGNY